MQMVCRSSSQDVSAAMWASASEVKNKVRADGRPEVLNGLNGKESGVCASYTEEFAAQVVLGAEDNLRGLRRCEVFVEKMEERLMKSSIQIWMTS